MMATISPGSTVERDAVEHRVRAVALDDVGELNERHASLRSSARLHCVSGKHSAK